MISILHRIVNIFEVCLVEMENQVLKETEPEIPQEELVSDKPGPKEDVISTHINFEDEEDKEDELDANEIELAKEYRQLNEYEDSGEDDDDCEDTEEAEESKEQPTATNELPESVKSDSAIDSRLVPVKKGDFFEHDNRDNENTDKAEETIATAAQNLKIKPISNKESAKAAPNAAAAAAAGEKGRDTQEKWTHDLFDKQQEEKKEQLIIPPSSAESSTEIVASESSDASQFKVASENVEQSVQQTTAVNEQPPTFIHPWDGPPAEEPVYPPGTYRGMF